MNIINLSSSDLKHNGVSSLGQHEYATITTSYGGNAVTNTNSLSTMNYYSNGETIALYTADTASYSFLQSGF